MENNKYLLSMMVAKRAKELREGAKPLVETKNNKPIIIALEEIKAGKVYLKEEEGPLKAEQIFNEDKKPEDISNKVEEPAKPEELSDEVEEPAKPEELSDEVEKPAKDEELSDEVEKPVEIEEIFKKDEEFGKSKG